MTKEERSITEAEEFVRRVLSKSFNQHVDAETLRAVAEKVSQAVASSAAPKKAA
jgi:hypothetical protein